MSVIFVDTNILVYAYDVDAGEKHVIAQALLRDCWEARSGVVSTQVLQEFYNTVTRKLTKKLSPQSAREIVGTYQAWPVYCPTVDDILSASELEKQHTLSFWDSLIVVAAQNLGADILISEDLQDGRQIGNLKITNPFVK
jgi:predicted nucleic acid-binding protein